MGSWTCSWRYWWLKYFSFLFPFPFLLKLILQLFSHPPFYPTLCLSHFITIPPPSLSLASPLLSPRLPRGGEKKGSV
ncbi:hypothetical protein B9Z19DRAFT_1095068 [Tuber borchii]|uniref:Uncharacterized protein n=1 Tax=Tuber borchii TaxID=42251 RepID=A0A2T6ZD52_TUBBO|nr:hypothetical protein B9Z19DRAFT_1095068 [Tuber borchii]